MPIPTIFKIKFSIGTYFYYFFVICEYNIIFLNDFIDLKYAIPISKYTWTDSKHSNNYQNLKNFEKPKNTRKN